MKRLSFLNKSSHCQARSQDFLRGSAIQREDGPNQAGALSLDQRGGGGTRSSEIALNIGISQTF